MSFYKSKRGGLQIKRGKKFTLKSVETASAAFLYIVNRTNKKGGAARGEILLMDLERPLQIATQEERAYQYALVLRTEREL
jgi:hypothetical protein